MRALCSCGAERVVPTYTLIQKLGPGKMLTGKDLPDLAKRMLCGSCKKRGNVSLKIVRE